MTITSVQYLQDDFEKSSILKAIINGKELYVPLDPANRHYAEIMRQVEAGTLTIQEAE